MTGNQWKKAVAIFGLVTGAAFTDNRGVVSPVYRRDEAKAAYQRPAAIPFPPENEYTREREKLGRTLFFDPRLSGAQNTSCATCHNPGFAWGDALPRAIGAGSKVLKRRTPTILNSAWADLLFWDGRAETLEEQAMGPVQSPDEMNQSLPEMVARVEAIAGYQALFGRAYPGEPIGERTIAKAIAIFERTVVSGTAPFDRWVNGDDSALTEPAKRGFDIFHTKGACVKCHTGWNFSDNGFHDIAVAGSDKGRGAVLPLESSWYSFKTPGLRDIDRRGPYMHDGSEATLEDVIEFYDRGGRERRPTIAPEIAPLHLTALEKSDLIAFLHALTGATAPVKFPVLPR